MFITKRRYNKLNTKLEKLEQQVNETNDILIEQEVNKTPSVFVVEKIKEVIRPQNKITSRN